jgi:hypothetical protein
LEYTRLVFLTLMILGLTGLVVMALPAFGGHHATHVHSGHGGAGHALGAGHAPTAHGAAGTHVAAGSGAHGAHGAHHLGTGGARAARGPGRDLVPVDPGIPSRFRFVPSPRAICSVLALYGAFGNALVHAAHLTLVLAALIAIVPTLLLERFMVRPVWNLLFRFQGEPSSPMDELILGEARAVVAFRNGRGIVSTVRDGRSVQLAAQLTADQAQEPVNVGDLVRIENVDARRERVVVSVLRD